MNYDYFVKVILVGDAGVGKTSLATSMAGEQPVVDYIPTIGMDFKVVRQKQSDGSLVKMHLWDSAGEKVFRGILESYCACIGGAVFVFDITKRDSFRSLGEWVALVGRAREGREGCSFPAVVVGNKLDLAQKRVVGKDEGMAFAESIGAEYMETSARGGISTERLTRCLIEKLVRPKQHGDMWGVPDVMAGRGGRKYARLAAGGADGDCGCWLALWRRVRNWLRV